MLTQEQIRSFTYSKTAPEKDIRWCKETRGFGLRIYPSGKKSFVHYTRFPQRLVTIGHFPELTLEEARARIDPKNKVTTFFSLVDEYLTLHAKPNKKTWRKDERYLRRCACPAFGNKPLADILPIDVLRLFTHMGQKSPIAANRCLEVLKKCFNFGIDNGFCTNNPARRIKKNGEKSRDRFAQPAELPSLISAIEQYPERSIRLALLFMFATGCRKSEALTLSWDDVNFDQAIIRFRDTKNGSNHFIPMTECAKEILQTAKNNSDIVFSSSRTGRPLVSINHAWKRICRAAGVRDLRIHDIRRTVGSWMAANGASELTIAKLLNHRSTKSTRTYARLNLEPVASALESYQTSFRSALSTHRPTLVDNEQTAPRNEHTMGRAALDAITVGFDN